MNFQFSNAYVYAFLLFETMLVLALFSLIRALHRLRRDRDALLQEKDVVFNFVHDVGEAFADADTVDLLGLLKRVLFYALRTTRAGSGALYLMEADGETLRAHAVSGIFPPIAGGLTAEMDTAFSKIKLAETLVRTQTTRVGEGLVGEVAAGGRSILISDAELDPRVPRFSIDFFRIHSILLVPMRFHNEVLGVLVVVNRVDSQPFIEADQNLLQALADQASVSIHYARFSAALDEKRRMDYDLSIARRIQGALLPKALPTIPGVQLAAFSVPAQEIGGDYYDMVQIDEEHIGIAIADVSGKGIAAALVMSMCRSLLRLEAPGSLSPASVLRTMNRIMQDDIAEDMFISMLYVVLNTRTRELAAARAGHNPAVLIPGDNSAPSDIGGNGMAIGMVAPATFDAALEETQTTLRPGDLFVAYTDGVTEAMDPGGNEWGVLNLVKTAQISAIEGASAAEAAASVQKKLFQFVGDTPQYDDMTLVVLRVG